MQFVDICAIRDSKRDSHSLPASEHNLKMPPTARKKTEAVKKKTGTKKKTGKRGAAGDPPTRPLQFSSMWLHYEQLLEGATLSQVKKLYLKLLEVINEHNSTTVIPQSPIELKPSGAFKYAQMWSQFDELLAHATPADRRKINLKFIKAINNHLDT